MLLTRFDISAKRFNPLWLIVGAVIGRAIGLIGGLNFQQWYFATAGPVVGWQVFGMIFFALLFSFLMTSNAGLNLKFGLLGLGIAFAIALYGGEIWAMFQAGRSPAWFTGMTTSEGIFFEWLLIHTTWIGGIVGMIAGLIVQKKSAAVKIASPDSQNSTPDNTKTTTVSDSMDITGENEQD